MGKKVKQEKQEEQTAQEKTPKISPIEKYLPHNKYVIKRTKLQNAKK